jgi:hypothetical protein
MCARHQKDTNINDYALSHSYGDRRLARPETAIYADRNVALGRECVQ